METIDTDLYGYYVKSVLNSGNTNFALVCNIELGISLKFQGRNLTSCLAVVLFMEFALLAMNTV